MQKNYDVQIDLKQIEAFNDTVKNSLEKVNNFKERLKSFEEVKSLEEAKALAAKIMPVSGEFNKFSIGDAKCTIINKKDLFRISVDSEQEFIVYDFS